MQIFADPFWGRVATTLIFGAMGLFGYFSFDIFLFVTRRNFGKVNINVAIFTNRDYKSEQKKGTNSLHFKSIETNVPVREILRNRYLFLYIVFRSFRASLKAPVLNFFSREYAILSPTRGRAARATAGMEFKRMAGMPFIETPYWLCFVYDLSEDPKRRRTRILRVFLIPQDAFERFSEHLKDPPKNTRNWELMKKIYESYANKTGSFIDVKITTA